MSEDKLDFSEENRRMVYGHGILMLSEGTGVVMEILRACTGLTLAETLARLKGEHEPRDWKIELATHKAQHERLAVVLQKITAAIEDIEGKEG